MHLYLSLVVILVIHTSTVIPPKARNTKDTDWKAISSLTSRAYSEYDRNKRESQKLFAEAAEKLEVYLRKYETNPEQLSYLRALVQLGALYQNADNLKQARIVFEQCERHRAFNSPGATLSVTANGRKVQETIANYVRARLCFLTDCSKPEHKVRITGSGSSRGDELAPPFSIPKPKVHRHNHSRAPLE